jgi:GNAT superfamily N-acetyltransferase
MVYYHRGHEYTITMIRTFIPEDADPCCSLIHACIDKDAAIPAALRDKMIRSESPHTVLERSRLFYMAVYESDSRISGVAGLDMNEIRLLCVSPAHQRHGIGRALLNHMISLVPEYLFPDVFVYSSLEAVPFYQAAGFEERGPAAFVFAGAKLQTVFMTRSTGFLLLTPG